MVSADRNRNVELVRPPDLERQAQLLVDRVEDRLDHTDGGIAVRRSDGLTCDERSCTRAPRPYGMRHAVPVAEIIEPDASLSLDLQG